MPDTSLRMDAAAISFHQNQKMFCKVARAMAFETKPALSDHADEDVISIPTNRHLSQILPHRGHSPPHPDPPGRLHHLRCSMSVDRCKTNTKMTLEETSHGCTKSKAF